MFHGLKASSIRGPWKFEWHSPDHPHAGGCRHRPWNPATWARFWIGAPSEFAGIQQNMWKINEHHPFWWVNQRTIDFANGPCSIGNCCWRRSWQWSIRTSLSWKTGGGPNFTKLLTSGAPDPLAPRVEIPQLNLISDIAILEGLRLSQPTSKKNHLMIPIC